LQHEASDVGLSSGDRGVWNNADRNGAADMGTVNEKKSQIEPELADQVGPKLGKLYERSIKLYQQFESEAIDSVWNGVVDHSVIACGFERHWSGPLLKLLKMSEAVDDEGRKGHLLLLGEPTPENFRMAQDRLNVAQTTNRDVKISDLNNRLNAVEDWIRKHDLAE
jgi:hypothetical protein